MGRFLHSSLHRRTFVAGTTAALIAGSRGISSTKAQGVIPGSILFAREGNIWVWSDGEASELVTDGAASDPRWSPAQDAVLFVRVGDSYSNLVVHWLGDGSESLLTNYQPGYDPGSAEYVQFSSWAQDPAWSPTGRLVYVADAAEINGAMMLWSLDSLESTPVPLYALTGEAGVESVTLSSNGGIAAYSVLSDNGLTTNVVLRDLSTGEVFPLVDQTEGAYDPAFSADDSHLSVSVREGDLTDLWLISRETGELQRLTQGMRAVASTWSPDGRFIAFLSPTESEFTLSVAPVNETYELGDIQELGRFSNLDATSGLSWAI